MKPKVPEQTSDTEKTAGRSLNKYLAIATMAASLGVSLGVPVVDVLASEGPGSPPSSSRQLKKDAAGQTNKAANQSKQFKESNQGKFKQQKVDTKSQVNK